MPQDRPTPAFSARQERVLRAFARALIPPGAGPLPAGDEVDLAAAADRFFSGADRESLRAFRAMLFLFEWLPLPFVKLRPFTALDDAGRAAVVADWAGSRLYLRRMLFVALKSLAGIAYASDPRVEDALGYRAHCLRGEPADPPAGDGVTGLGTAPLEDRP